MTQATHPDKELVRKVMTRQRVERRPPMTPEQARTELGWKLIRDERPR